jgi:hypothetical protein
MIHHDVPLDLGLHTGAALTSPATKHAPDRQHVRWTVIHRIRREIAEGSYETPEKWHAVVARLLERGVL